MAVRVHELAKEFGVPSKIILSTLQDMGEYVKSASSTVEAPVVRRLNEEHGDALREQGAKKAAKKAPAAKKAERPRPSPSPPRPRAGGLPKLLWPSPHPRSRSPSLSRHRSRRSPWRRHPRRLDDAEEAAPAEKPAGAASRPAPGGARPGNNPFSSRRACSRSARRVRRQPVRVVRRHVPACRAPTRR